MKKSLRKLTAMALCFALIVLMPLSVEATGNITSTSATITSFFNYYAEGNTLSSLSQTTTTASIDIVASAELLRITGSDPLSAFDISSLVQDGAFTAPTDANQNYDVLSVMVFPETIRIVLKDKSAANMRYVEFDNPYDNAPSSYNQNWYVTYVSSQLLEEHLAQPMLVSTQNNRSYYQTSDIYGDIYKETIVIQHQSLWPDTLTANQVGQFKVTLGIYSKETQITRYGSTTSTTVQGNSLLVNGISVKAATPAGEFFTGGFTYYDGQSGGTVLPFRLDISYAIPDSPLSLALDLDHIGADSSGPGEEDRWSFSCPMNASTGEGVMLSRINFHGPGRRLEEPANSAGILQDTVAVDFNIASDDSNFVAGRKGFSYQWEYIVTSTGEANGVAVTVTTQNCVYANTLYYTVPSDS